MRRRRSLWLRRGLLAVVVALAAWATVELVNAARRAGGFEQRLDRAEARLSVEPPAGDADTDSPDGPGGRAASAAEADSPHLAAARRFERSYTFMPEPPPAYRQVAGILGDRVIFRSGQTAGIGESFGGATVKAVGSDWVDLEVEGETITIGVFGGRGSRPPSRP